MAKDYAKKKPARKKGGASRSKKQQKKPLGLIFTIFVLMSGLVTLLVYLKWYQPRAKTIQKVEKTSNKTPSKPVKKTTKTHIDQTPDDEVPFYRTHQEMMNKTVEIPIEDLQLAENDHQYSYTMPCGSFREISRAEELKAQIALTGYESKIIEVKSQSQLWHRVTLGPFTSKRKAESIRHRLQDNGFINCKIWPKRIK
ncbi:MAG: SPOR domain-containing protein [Kangiellaceae bacterium]